MTIERGLAGRIAAAFVHSKLTPLLAVSRFVSVCRATPSRSDASVSVILAAHRAARIDAPNALLSAPKRSAGGGRGLTRFIMTRFLDFMPDYRSAVLHCLEN